MTVRSLRLERGWSQEQLAQISGLNIRTIQRIEGGQKAGLESLKSLAAVFEVDLSQLKQEPSMSDATVNPAIETTAETVQETSAAQTANSKLKKARAKVLILGARFAVISGILFAINLLTAPDHIWAWWPTMGMAIAFAFKCVDKLIIDPLKEQSDSK